MVDKSLNLAPGSLEDLSFSQKSPWTEVVEGGGLGGRIPAILVAGGEGEEGEEHDEVEGYL
jgi:hypothetical protein